MKKKKKNKTNTKLTFEILFNREGRWNPKNLPYEHHLGVNPSKKTLGLYKLHLEKKKKNLTFCFEKKKNQGIIGLGGIGTVFAKKARKAFDMRILYHNRQRVTKTKQTNKQN